MILIPDNLRSKMTVVAGNADAIYNKPTPIFDTLRIKFLSNLSRRILADSRIKELPDVATFAYWCRNANLIRMGKVYKDDQSFRMGLGLTFHICPANVPVNFAFSMAFGLLSGNSCVLRLPSKSTRSLELLVDSINEELNSAESQSVRNSLLLIRYGRDDEITKFWMSISDGRIVWGGDNTVSSMRKFPSKPRSREVAFSDRFSLCLIEPGSISLMDEASLHKFCQKLFNDIYLMDQAACSSPQLFVWIGKPVDIRPAQDRLWSAMTDFVEQRYSPQPVQIIDKFVGICREAFANSEVISINRSSNLLYRVHLKNLVENQDACRGYFGTIHEVELSSLDFLAPIVNERYQTITTQGICNNEIKSFIARNGLQGIDRVVPVGSALDMGLIWDGYDMIGNMSRVISI